MWDRWWPFRAPPALPAAGCPLSTEARARQLLDARMDSMRALVKARQALRDAETADLKAYRTALGDGWSVDEIVGGRQVGIRIEADILMFFDLTSRELLRVRPNPLTH
jgi:hypothetical protein